MAKLILSTPAAAMRLQENDVEMDYDGGRVVLVCDQDKALKKGDIQQITTVVNYLDDEPMRAWPTNREERGSRRFALLVVEGATEEDLQAVAELLESRAASPSE